MNHQINLSDQQLDITAKALRLLRDVHLGKLEAISKVCEPAEDVTPHELEMKLLQASPLITGKSPGEKLDLASKVVSEEARIADRLCSSMTEQAAGG